MQDVTIPRLKYDCMTDALRGVAGQLACDGAVQGLALYGPASYLRNYPESTHLWITCHDERPEVGIEVAQFYPFRVHVKHIAEAQSREELLAIRFADRPPLTTAFVMLDRHGLVTELTSLHRKAFLVGPEQPTESRLSHARSSISMKIWQAKGLTGNLATLRGYLVQTLAELFRLVLVRRGIWPLHAAELFIALPELASDLSDDFDKALTISDGRQAWEFTARVCEHHLAALGGLTKPGERLTVF